MHTSRTQKRLIVGLGLTGLSAARYCVRQGWAFDLCDTRTQLANRADIQQEFPQAKLYLGELQDDLLCQYDELIVSPGVAIAHPAIRAAKQEGVRIAGDIQLFVDANTQPVIAITGSNGKSTVTSLVGELLKACGKNVAVGGNIGLPALDMPNADLYVLELSSFQLETTTNLQAAAATILNLSEDHMDRYRGMDDYLAAKQRIFQGAQQAVVNRDDSATQAPLGMPCISFGVDKPEAGQYGLIKHQGESWIAFGDEPVIAASSLKIKGQHNLANVMAALALLRAVGIEHQQLLPALSAFSGLDHRCQWVGSKDNVAYYNDSKGTNVGSTLAAINGLGPEIRGKIWLLAGGDGKGQDFTPLAQPCAQYAAEVLTFGADAALVANAVSGGCAVSQHETLAQALERAAALANEGDVVLLSPACASLDQFKNYVQRGEHFRSLVEAML